jgi:hypothetical protein
MGIHTIMACSCSRFCSGCAWASQVKLSITAVKMQYPRTSLRVYANQHALGVVQAHNAGDDVCAGGQHQACGPAHTGLSTQINVHCDGLATRWMLVGSETAQRSAGCWYRQGLHTGYWQWGLQGDGALVSCGTCGHEEGVMWTQW